MRPAPLERYRLLIAAFKIVSGSVEIASGLLLAATSYRTLDRLITKSVSSLAGSNPGLASFLERELHDLASHKQSLALLLVGLGSSKVVGAIGFLRRKSWGFYVMLSVLVLYLPYDAVLIAEDGSLFTIGSALLDLVIIAVMIRYRHGFLYHEQHPALERLLSPDEQ